MKCGIYCRTSVEHESSIEQQSKEGIEFCRQNFFEYEVYADDDVSGYNVKTDDSGNVDFEDRPELNRLQKDIKSGIIKQVWVFELSRLSRNENLTAKMFNIFDKYKVDLYEKNKKLDLDDPHYRFLRQVLAAVSELERANIIARTGRGLRQKRNEGKRSNQAFFGYEKAGKNESGKTIWKPVESELNIMRYTYEQLKNGSSIRQILYDLYDDRFLSLAEFKVFQRRLVQMVRRFEYTGHTWTHEGAIQYKKVLKGETADINSLDNKEYIVKSRSYPEEIISVKDWFKIFEKNIIRKRFIDERKEAHIKTASSGLLTGIIECAKCGFKYYNFKGGQNKKTGSDYTYYKHHAAFLRGCNQKPKSFKKNGIDEIFKKFIFFHTLIFDNTIEAMEKTQFIIKQEITAIQENITKIEKTLKKSDQQLERHRRISLDGDDDDIVKGALKSIAEIERRDEVLIKDRTSLIIKLEKLNTKYAGTERDKFYHSNKDLIQNWFNNFNDEERRNHLIKIMKRCLVFGQYLLIDTGAMVYLFDTKMDNVFDMDMLENLDSDKIYKEYITDWNEKIDTQAKKQKSKMLIVNVDLNKSKTARAKTVEYLNQIMGINHDIAEASNIIDFTSRRSLYEINKKG